MNSPHLIVLNLWFQIIKYLHGDYREIYLQLFFCILNMPRSNCFGGLFRKLSLVRKKHVLITNIANSWG